MALRYAVRELRGLGRELVSGSWAVPATPMAGHEAIALMFEAFAKVCNVGVDAVIAGVERRLTDIAKRLMSEALEDVNGEVEDD